MLPKGGERNFGNGNFGSVGSGEISRLCEDVCRVGGVDLNLGRRGRIRRGEGGREVVSVGCSSSIAKRARRRQRGSTSRGICRDKSIRFKLPSHGKEKDVRLEG